MSPCSVRVLESIKEGKKLAESLFKVLDSEIQNCIKTFAVPVTGTSVKTEEAVEIIGSSQESIEGNQEKLPSSAREASTADGAIVISSSQ